MARRSVRISPSWGARLSAVSLVFLGCLLSHAFGDVPFSAPQLVWPAPASPYLGNLVPAIDNDGHGWWGLAFADFDNGNVMLTRSQDNGVTWDTPSVIASGYGVVEIRIQTAANGTWCVTMYDPYSHTVYATRSTDHGATWSTPTPVVTGVRMSAHLATDDAGVFTVASVGPDPVGVDGIRSVQISRSSDDGITWSAPVIVSSTDELLYLSDLAGDPDGVLEVVWTVPSPDSFLNAKKIYSSRSTDGGLTWGPRTLLYEWRYPTGSNLLYDYFCSVAPIGGGQWVAVGQARDEDLTWAGGVATISRDGGFSWGDPHMSQMWAYQSSVAADGQGNVLLTGAVGSVGFERSPDNGRSWLAPQTGIGTAGTARVKASMDADGHWILAWYNSADTSLYLARSLPEVDTDSDGLPDMAETNTGTYVSAWSTGTDPNVADTDGDGVNDGDEVTAGTYPLGTTWPDVHDPVTPGAFSMTQPDVVVDDASGAMPATAGDGTGRWITTWSASDGSQYNIHLSTTLDNGESWSSPVTLVAGKYPRIAVNAEGTWMLAYRGADDTVQVSISNDDGGSWTAPVTATGSFISSPPRVDRIVSCGGCRWLLSVSNSGQGFETVATDNDGATWAAPVVHTTTGYGPTMVYADAGVCLGATYDLVSDSVVMVRSADYGATWTLLALDASVGSAVTLVGMAYGDGVCLLVLGTDSNTRLSVSRSTDGGLTWTVPTTASEYPSGFIFGLETTVAADGAGNALLVTGWPGGEAFGIARSWNHGISWTDPGFLTPFEASSYQVRLWLAMDSAGGGLVVWQDSGRIYCSHLDTSQDSDGDGLSDYAETGTGAYVSADSAGSDPYNPDSDGDGLPDAWEADNGLNPNDDGSVDRQQGPSGDPDHDGFSNREEYLAGTNPTNQQSSPLTDGGPGVPVAGAGAVILLLAAVAAYGGRKLANTRPSV